MGDDLIERLRAYQNPNGGEVYRALMDEAADEIERLNLIAAATEARDLLAARVTVAGRSVTVAELIAAHEREQWQPIETAPRDETRFLAWSPGGYAILHWAEFTDMDDGSGAFWGEDECDPIEGIEAPVMWRPLPEPPAPTETEGA